MRELGNLAASRAFNASDGSPIASWKRSVLEIAKSADATKANAAITIGRGRALARA
jgi:hypothetical protein